MHDMLNTKTTEWLKWQGDFLNELSEKLEVPREILEMDFSGGTYSMSKALGEAKIVELRERLKVKMKERDERLKEPEPKPRYDEVFFNGVEWLDTL